MSNYFDSLTSEERDEIRSRKEKMSNREKTLKRIKEIIADLEQIQSNIYTVIRDDKSDLNNIEVCAIDETAFDLSTVIYKLENI